MDDRAFEVTVENGSDVNEMEEQPNDEEPRYWPVCSLHRITGGSRWDFVSFAGKDPERTLVTGNDYISEEAE